MEFSLLSDSCLIESYIQGDENALEFLIRKHQKRIYNFIYSKVRNKDVANDLFQDVFIKVINTLKMGNYNEEGESEDLPSVPVQYLSFASDHRSVCFLILHRCFHNQVLSLL